METFLKTETVPQKEDNPGGVVRNEGTLQWAKFLVSYKQILGKFFTISRRNRVQYLI